MHEKRALGALWCLLCICAGMRLADAHAYVVASSPAVNGTVGAPLDRVTVSFDEPVTIESSTPLVVRDGSGAVAACAGGARVNPDDVTQIVCAFATPLAQGAYTVDWRVTSADTHVVHGEFSFGVGLAVSARAGETRSAYDPSGILATLLRWLVLVGTLAIAGGIGFAQFVLRRAWFPEAAAPAVAVLQRSSRRLIAAGLWCAFPASALAFVVQAAAATGTDPLRALAHSGEVAFGSNWGVTWLVRIVALATVGVTFRRHGRAVAIPLLAAAAALPLTLSLSGHALASGSTWNESLAVKADAIHTGAAALWSGGLCVFVLGFRASTAALAADERAPFVRTLVARFSAIAVASVAAIVVTGTYAAVVHLGSWGALVADVYGRIVLAKIVLLIPLLGLGFANARRSRPDVSHAGILATVGAETGLVFLIVALSAVLTGQPLPHPPP